MSQSGGNNSQEGGNTNNNNNARVSVDTSTLADKYAVPKIESPMVRTEAGRNEH